MTHRPDLETPHRSSSRAFTLLEMLISMGVMSIILGTLTMAMVFTGRAVEVGAASTGEGRDASVELSDRIGTDLRLARSFTERTATAVAFSVPDRDGDGLDETLRYAWDGTPGHPITMSYNSDDPLVVSPSVHDFALAYDVTTIVGTGGSDEGATENGLRVLFVVKRSDQLDTGEVARKFLFESWGQAVTLIDDEDPASAYETAFAASDVVYVSDQVDDNKLGSKLTGATVGVVTEHRETVDDLDLAEARFQSQNGASIVIDDDGHYITRPFFPGILPILSGTESLIHSDEITLAAGARALASEPGRSGRAMLVTLDTGQPLYSGAPAAGRRVILPWSNNIDVNVMNEHGHTLLQRALEWAAGQERPDVDEEALFAQYENPAATAKSHSVSATAWAVASIVPDLPADAITWKVTRVRFIAEQKGDPTATLVVQVRERGPSGAPLPTVLGQSFIAESELPIAFAPFEVEIAMAVSIRADEGACIAIGMLAGSNGATILYEDSLGTATPSNQYIKGKPGDWDAADPDKDLPIEVFGTTEVSILE